MKLDDEALERLIHAARQADLPDQARLAGIRSRLLPGPAGAPPQPSAALKLTAKWLTAKTLIGITVVGLSGLSYWQLQHASTQPGPAEVQSMSASHAQPGREGPPSTADVGDTTVNVFADEPQPSQAQPNQVLTRASKPATSARTSPGRIKRTPPRASNGGHTPTTSEPGSTLKEEAALLRSAALAARADDAQAARRLLERFDQTYPSSQLQSERDRIRRSLDAAASTAATH